MAEIQIEDLSRDGVAIFQLLVDGEPKGRVTKKGGLVEINWQIYGPTYWPDHGKALMQGLLDLSVIADQLSGESEW
jgi:hypothetical protein